MAVLVSTVISDVGQVFNDIPTATQILLFNEAHAAICRHVKLYADEVVDLSLTSGTQGYALSEDVIRIWNAAYFTSASAYTMLEQTSVDELDQTDHAWRGDSSGTPSQWYDEGPNIGLYPKPDTTTSAGYPIVRLYVQKRRVLATSDTLPAQIISHDAWIDMMCFKWARRTHNDRLQVFGSLARNSLNALAWDIMGRAPRLKPTITFDVPRIQH